MSPMPTKAAQIDWLMKRDGLTRKQALQQIAQDEADLADAMEIFRKKTAHLPAAKGGVRRINPMDDNDPVFKALAESLEAVIGDRFK